MNRGINYFFLCFSAKERNVLFSWQAGDKILREAILLSSHDQTYAYKEMAGERLTEGSKILSLAIRELRSKAAKSTGRKGA